jgi:hypothetical protein
MPGGAGARSAKLTVANDAGGSQNVTLAGNGTVPVASAQPGSLQWTVTNSLDPTTAKAVTVSNNGAAPMVLGSPTVEGQDAKDFTVSSDCRGELAPHAFCTLTVQYKIADIPNVLTKCSQAFLTIQDDDAVAPKQQVPMSAGAVGCLLPLPKVLGAQIRHPLYPMPV